MMNLFINFRKKMLLIASVLFSKNKTFLYYDVDIKNEKFNYYFSTDEDISIKFIADIESVNQKASEDIQKELTNRLNKIKNGQTKE